MLTIRTDLAMEAHQLWREGAGEGPSLPGVRAEERERDGFPVTTVTVSSREGAQALGKPEGVYVTIELDGLLRREEGLDQEQLALDRAARLCRELREERADFATLDPRRYLDRLEQEKCPAALREDQLPRKPFHIRRYCARMLDWLIWITLASLALTAGECLGVPLPEDTHLTAAFLSFGLMAVSETLLLHFTGATLGKKLLGMRLLREDGSFLTLREAAGRTLQVMISFAFYILAVMYRVLGDSTAGYVNGISFLVVWAWRFGDEASSLLDKYFYFWKRDNELYLDGSTRDKSFWEREEAKPGVVAAGLLAAFCFWFTFALPCGL